MVSHVDTFIEKPFSVLTLSCIPASHPIVGASQNTLQRSRSNMSTTRKTSDSLVKPETEKPPALTLADKVRKLVARDRDFDEGWMCMECTNVIRPGGVTTCTKWWVASTPRRTSELTLHCCCKNAMRSTHSTMAINLFCKPSTVNKFIRKPLQ